MKKTIRYEDQYHISRLTPVQLQQVTAYYKVYETDGIVQKKELITQGKVKELIYYRQAGETEEQAMAMILAVYSLDYFDIREREAYSTYVIERSRSYRGDGQYDDYHACELYDAQGRLICQHTESFFKGELETETRKYVYDPTTGQEQYECLYDTNRMLRAIRGSGPPFVPENDHMVRVDEFPLFFPDFLAQHPYYATAALLPTMPLVLPQQ